jgi:hypothetical protein
MAQAVEEWYKQMPVITRSYLTAAVVTTIGCSLEVYSISSQFFFPILILGFLIYLLLIEVNLI